MEDELSLLAHRAIMLFAQDTFTTELDNNDSAVKELVRKGYIERHPGGPFGSRCSYYRTSKGMEYWTNVMYPIIEKKGPC